MFRAITRSELLSSSITELAAKSSIGNLNPGSKARALIEAIAGLVDSVSTNVSIGILETLLPNAEGATLDLLADVYGLERYESAPARAESSDNNFKYYVQGQTFGGINNGLDIVIPAGTQIKSKSASITTYFVQREDLVLPAASSELFFAADQINSPIILPVSANSMTKHDFVGYEDSAFNSLLVTNTKGLSGRSRESDNNLRFRIQSYLATSAGSNEIALRVAALSVPGVSDVRILNNRSGLGTFDVIVYGTSFDVPASIISTVQERINKNSAVGSIGIAVQPKLVGVSMRVNIKFKSTTSTGEKNSISQNVKSAIQEYIVNIAPGSQFIINDITNTILQISEEIIDIGVPGRPIDELLIWKSATNEGDRYSRKLENNYLVRENESIQVEPSLTTAIEITTS